MCSRMSLYCFFACYPLKKVVGPMLRLTPFFPFHSYDEAKMKIYSVSTRFYYAFGALVSEEVIDKLHELPNVRFVLPDAYLDVENKDYGGEPFINGKAVPYDLKYHEEWIKNNAPKMGFDLTYFCTGE
ncbi:hypothetical protein LXL04_037718 [Taraxacum kok-saghyz]